MPAPAILFEDNHLLVVNKPAGLATMERSKGEPSLVEWGARGFEAALSKAGQCLHRCGPAARCLGERVLGAGQDIESRGPPDRAVRRARDRETLLVCRRGECQTGERNRHDTLAKDDAARRVRTVSKTAPGAQTAALNYHVRARARTCNGLGSRLNPHRA